MGEKSIYRGMAADPLGPWRDLSGLSRQMHLDQVANTAKSLGLPAEMLQYLEDRQRLPNVTAAAYLPGDASGSFEYSPWYNDTEYGPAGKITLENSLLRPTMRTEGARTLSHELTHATERALNSQATDLSDENAQFREAYNKLLSPTGRVNNFKNPREELIKKLAPATWVEKNKDYRATPKEATAFGVGNSITTKNSDNIYRAPPHVDPTLATELAIVLELAQRKKKK